MTARGARSNSAVRSAAFVREIRALPDEQATERLRQHYALDAFAAGNVVQYLNEQAEATGVVPDDRTIVVERFRDEIGDWRVCVLSPFGTPVHAPWAMAIERRLIDRYDLPVETMWGDDGIVIRLPESADHLELDVFVIDPADIDELVVSSLPQTSLFSARFRECAGRALLLPRRRPDKRTPLWQQRQRAADLLAVASKYPTFPILLETSRECLQDVFDVPALREVLGQLQSRQLRLVQVDTACSSPMASSLLFNWIAQYMYEGDAPLAERRAAALSLDRDLLRELLGAEELRELLDPGVLADVELELQCLSDGRRARSPDELHDVLRKVGDLTAAEIDLRCEAASGADWLATLLAERRAIEIGIGDEMRLRRRRGCRPVSRCARVFAAARVADGVHRTGRPPARGAGRALRPHPWAVPGGRRRPPLERPDRTDRGCHRVRCRTTTGSCSASFVPTECSANGATSDVLRQLRRRSLAVLRKEVEPVEQDALARFVPAWHGIPAERRGAEFSGRDDRHVGRRPDRRLDTRDRRAAVTYPVAYRPASLDEMCTSGEVVWIGVGSIGARDGRIRLCFADQLALLAPGWERPDPPDGPIHELLRESSDAAWCQLLGSTPRGRP